MTMKNLIPGLIMGGIFVVAFFFGIALLNNGSTSNVTSAPASTVVVPNSGGISADPVATTTQPEVINSTPNADTATTPVATQKASHESEDDDKGEKEGRD